MLSCCRFGPGGKFVVAGGVDGKVHQWDLETEKKTSANGHPSWLVVVAIHKNRLFSADLQGTIICRTFPLDGKEPAWTVKDTHRPFLRAMAVSPDGKMLVTAGDDRTVRVWDAGSGKSIRSFEGHKGYVYSLAFHPKGSSAIRKNPRLRNPGSRGPESGWAALRRGRACCARGFRATRCGSPR